MCGIVGVISEREVAELLLTGLRRLEYRGYDSAGLAIIDPKQQLNCVRTVGKVQVLADQIQQYPIKGKLGVAHTRWATHGKPSERNAHPHCSHDTIAVVHNGIIENYEHLKKMLQEKGYVFASETDTEVIAHLIHWEYEQTHSLLKAIQKAIKQLKGAYALGIIHKDEPHHLIGVRLGSPLVVGLGIEENFIASDTVALLPFTQKFIFLEEGDIVDLSKTKVEVIDSKGHSINRKIQQSELKADIAQKNGFRHFMLKEIFEQPEALRQTLEGHFSHQHFLKETLGLHAEEVLAKTQHIQIVACGTSYHAALVGKYWIEELAHIPCQVEVASEFRYRSSPVLPGTLLITISQSGETADTLAALRKAKTLPYLSSLAICNSPESSLVRESDLILFTRAGKEIGVASTKAFTSQLLTLLILTGMLAKDLSEAEQQKLISLIESLPEHVKDFLTLHEQIAALAPMFENKEHALFLGRGYHYPIALEGALKLKEISYIHAEGYAAGELKHGPLALIDKDMIVIAMAPTNAFLDKMKSNLQEVKARGGQLLVFTDNESGIVSEPGLIAIAMPKTHDVLSPILYTVPLQLLAYNVALIKGTDVDQPRNLAKSVTVE